MTDTVPANEIEQIVGALRHPTDHYGRAVSAEQTVYILHSAECFATVPDLRDCPYSQALDDGIYIEDWIEDVPLVMNIIDGTLGPASLDPVRACRDCLCTDDHACSPPCSWVDLDLCSRCA